MVVGVLGKVVVQQPQLPNPPENDKIGARDAPFPLTAAKDTEATSPVNEHAIFGGLKNRFAAKKVAPLGNGSKVPLNDPQESAIFRVSFGYPFPKISFVKL